MSKYVMEIRLLPENDNFYELLTFILQAKYSFML